MALELECTIARKLDVVNGTSQRGPWSKQEFIVQYQDGNYPNQLVLNVWGEEKVKDLEQYNIGDVVKVSLTPSSREYNGRWYTDIRAWKIERSSAQPAQPAEVAAPAPVSAPVASAPAPQTPAAITIDESSSNDDLPF